MASTTLIRPLARASQGARTSRTSSTADRLARRDALLAQADRSQALMGPGYGVNVTGLSSAEFKQLTRRLMGRG